MADLLDNEESRTLHEKIRSGLVSQLSFAFPLDSKTVDEGTLKGLPRRRVMEISRLLDVCQ
jgi:phage head maturation protease